MRMLESKAFLAIKITLKGQFSVWTAMQLKNSLAIDLKSY